MNNIDTGSTLNAVASYLFNVADAIQDIAGFIDTQPSNSLYIENFDMFLFDLHNSNIANADEFEAFIKDYVRWRN